MNPSKTKLSSQAYLSQLQQIDVIINQKLEELTSSRASLTSLSSPDFTTPKVRGGSSDTDARFSRTLVKAVDLEKEIDEEVDSYIDKKHQIINQIQMLSNTNYIEILYKRYVEYKALKQIAVEMEYDYSYIRRLHGQALKVFEENILLKK